MALILHLYRANQLRKWRQEVKLYWDAQEKFTYHMLILSDNSFTLVQDDEQVIERWSNFRRVKIHQGYVELIGDENYLILIMD